MRDLLLDLFRYTPSLVLPAAIGIIEILVLTSVFHPDDYGLYALVLSTITFMALSTGWMGTTIVRFYPRAERQGEAAGFVAAMLLVYGVLAILVSLATVAVFTLAPGLIPGALSDLLPLCIPVYVLLSLSQTLQQFYRARRQIRYFNALAIWQHVGRLAFGLLLVIVFDMGVAGLLWGYALALLIGIPPVLLLSKLPVSGLMEHRDSQSDVDLRVPALVRYGWPLALCNTGAWVIMYLDRYMLEVFQGPEAVGVYAASYNLSERLMMVVLTIFLLASRPLEMASWETEGRERMATALRNATRLYLLSTLPLVVLLSVLAREMLLVFAGAAYADAYRTVPYFVAGAFLLGIHQRYQGPLLVRQKTGLILLLFCAAGLFNVALNTWVIPVYGYQGSAVVKLLSYVLLAAITVIAARRYLAWRFPYVSLFRCALSLAALWAATHQVKRVLDASPLMVLVVAGSVGLIVYAIALLLLGELSADERSKLGKVVRRS